jgi:hypothetical protein
MIRDIYGAILYFYRWLFRLSRAVSEPLPQVTADDVMMVVRRDFAEEKFGIVMAVLNEYGVEKWECEKPRVQLAALKLSNGDLEALNKHINLAKQDYRDVLAAAEYPEYSTTGMFHVRELPAQAQRRIIDSDWKQCETWLRSSTTQGNEARRSESAHTRSGSAVEPTRRDSSSLGRC